MGLLNVSVSDSLPSTKASSEISTMKVLLTSPAPKLRVPETFV